VFLNYFKTAYRNLAKNKFYSSINIMGLAIGLTFFLLAALYVDFATHFDSFHERAERIYGIVRVVPSGNQGEQHSAITPGPLAQALLSEYPEIENAVNFYVSGNDIVRYQNKIFYEDGILYTNSEFLSVFSFKMISGNPETALSEPGSIILTESSALKYFGDENPLGKSMTFNKTQEITVTGIIEDVPLNSSLRFNFIRPVNTNSEWVHDWTINGMTTILLLPEKFNPAIIEEKFPSVIEKYFPVSPDSPSRLYLFPLLDFHLKSQHIRSMFFWDSTEQLYLAYATGIVFLLVVSLNYMSLSVARYVNRAREVGMRKVIGANRAQLAKQFLGESLLSSILAFPLTIVIFELIEPHFNALFGSVYDLSLWNSPKPLLIFIGVTILTGLIAGSYPAFFVSAFKPSEVLKGNLQKGRKGTAIRKIIVVGQFAFTILLVVFSIIINSSFALENLA